MTGFPPLCAMCHVPAEGEFEGACPLMHAPPRASQTPLISGVRSQPRAGGVAPQGRYLT